MAQRPARIARQYTRTTILARSSERYCPRCRKVLTYRFDLKTQHSLCTGCGGYKAIDPSLIGQTDHHIVKLYDARKAARLAAQQQRKLRAERHECICGQSFPTFPQYVDHHLTCKQWDGS